MELMIQLFSPLSENLPFSKNKFMLKRILKVRAKGTSICSLLLFKTNSANILPIFLKLEEIVVIPLSMKRFHGI